MDFKGLDEAGVCLGVMGGLNPRKWRLTGKELTENVPSMKKYHVFLLKDMIIV